MTAETDVLYKKIYSISVKVTLAILGILITVFAFREIYSPDIGFHLKAGKWILQNLKFPDKDVFTYTVTAHDYIDMHWLYQIFVAVVNKWSGEFGLVASNAVLIIASFVLVVARLKIKSDLDELSFWQLFLFFAVTSVAVLFETRPHVFSWIYFNIILLILENYSAGRKNMLAFLPLTMLLWVNTHSLFILGWLAIGCYTVGLIWRDRIVWTPLMKYALLSFAVCFLNPYFIHGVAFPFRQFQLLHGANVFKSAIAELTFPLSLDSYFFNGRFIFIQPLLWFHIFLILSIIIFIKRMKRIQLHELLIFLFFGYLACTAVRNIGFFIFAVFPVTLYNMQSGANAGENGTRSRWHSLQTQLLLNTGISIIAVILTVSIFTGAYYNNYRSNERFGYRFNNLMVPVQAARYLQDNHLSGKMLNHFNFGGFLMYMLPQPVSIDGRNEVIGEEFYYAYSILWNAVDKKPMIDKYQPDIIIFPHQNDFCWVHYFKSDTAWRLVYFDELAAIYLRKGYADTVATFTYRERMHEYPQIDTSLIDSILHRPYPVGNSAFSLKQQYFPQREMGLSTFCYYDDKYAEAIRIGLSGLLKSTVSCPEIYYDLGHYFFENNEFERSAYCYQRYLENNSDALARERLRMIRANAKAK